MTWFIAMVLTIFVEAGVALGLDRLWRVRGQTSRLHFALAVMAVSLVTHPAAWLLYSVARAAWENHFDRWLMAEAGVTLAEAGMLRFALRQPFRRILALSSAMNGMSASIGMVWSILLGSRG